MTFVTLSIGVFPPIYSSARRKVFEYDDYVPIAKLKTGYGQTKWVAEHLVLLARRHGYVIVHSSLVPSTCHCMREVALMRRHRLCATIYRPGVVTGASDTGAANIEDFANRLLKGCLQVNRLRCPKLKSPPYLPYTWADEMRTAIRR